VVWVVGDGEGRVGLTFDEGDEAPVRAHLPDGALQPRPTGALRADVVAGAEVVLWVLEEEILLSVSSSVHRSNSR
jgi:hypothetical protein